MPINLRAKAIGLLLASVTLVVLCYGPTIPLPYFWDDVPHYLWVKDAAYADIWTNQVGYGYYRPLVFSFYKFVFNHLPFGATTLPHLGMLLVHAVNSFLVGLLGRLFWQKHNTHTFGLDISAVAGTLLFALFPFAALPVVHFASAMHPLVTLFVLSGVIATLKFSDTGHVGWYGGAAFVALLAPYLHESGIMAGALMALSWGLSAGRACLRRLARIVLLPALSATFLLVWFVVPKARTGGFHLGAWGEVLAKVSFFFQGLTYPVQPLAAYLIRAHQWWDLGAILLVGAGGLLLAGFVLREQRAWRLLALSVGWLGLAMLPMLVALPFSYMITSPRLIYFPGVGGAVLFGNVLTASLTNHKRRALNWAIAAGWLFAGVAVPFAYVQREVRLHVLALTPLQQLSAIARQYPTEQHLVVNSTNWLAYQTSVYPMGHDGVTVSASYILPPQLVYINTGIAMRGDFITVDELRPMFQYHYMSTLGEGESQNAGDYLQRTHQYDWVWVTKYSDANAKTELAGKVSLETPEAPPPTDYLARYEASIYLLFADYDIQDQKMSLSLHWLVYRPDLRPEATVFANVFDCAGNVIGLESGNPIGRLVSLASLPAGARVDDVRAIMLDAMPPDQCYQVEIGFFHGDGSRMRVFAPDGSEYPNSLFLFQK